MSSAASLYCPCGRRFFPKGGTAPGKLAKCPACGAWVRVPVAPKAEARGPARRKGGSAAGPSADDTLGACLLYPVTDGPGVALLVVMPLLLWVASVPVLDILNTIGSGPRGGFNPLLLLVAPLAFPLVLAFVAISGYLMLFLGGVLVAGALGEDVHPSWPTWDLAAIAEGLARWGWAALVGLAVGAFPMLVYWKYCGDIDTFDVVIFAELAAVGAGYGQMALAAALMHNSLLAANPKTVVAAIGRVGWSYLRPSLASGFAVVLGAAILYGVLLHAPSVPAAAVGLWGFWVYTLYASMVCLRILGLTYYARAEELGWFKVRPKWAIWGRQGTIYANM